MFPEGPRGAFVPEKAPIGFAGGYVQGGGHKPFNGFHGMAADAVLAYQAVTAAKHHILICSGRSVVVVLAHSA